MPENFSIAIIINLQFFFFFVIRVNGFQTMLKTSGLLHGASLTLFLIDLIAI